MVSSFKSATPTTVQFVFLEVDTVYSFFEPSTVVINEFSDGGRDVILLIHSVFKLAVQ